ncbi:hypothetical protein E2562_028806, partial [Oryza meyeriana var. granulata]
GVPRLVSYGMGAFTIYVAAVVTVHKPHTFVGSPSEPFIFDGLLGLWFTRANLNPPFDEPEPTSPLWDFMCETNARAPSRTRALSPIPFLSSNHSASTAGAVCPM